MTKQKAAETASALVGFDYFPIVALRQDGEYTVTAQELSPGAGIALADGVAFQTSLGITGKTPTMVFV